MCLGARTQKTIGRMYGESGEVLQKVWVVGSNYPSCSNFLLAFMNGLRWVHCHEYLQGEEVYLSAKPSDSWKLLLRVSRQVPSWALQQLSKMKPSRTGGRWWAVYSVVIRKVVRNFCDFTCVDMMVVWQYRSCAFCYFLSSHIQLWTSFFLCRDLLKTEKQTSVTRGR